MNAPSPLRREIRVATTAARAFELFTERIGEWWPVETHSVHAGSVAFEGSELVERSGAERSVWAEVLEWDAPSSLALSWHPGSDPARATHIRVTFTEDGEGTLVSLVHSGWERTEKPEENVADYGQGWPMVLGRFGDLVRTE